MSGSSSRENLIRESFILLMVRIKGSGRGVQGTDKLEEMGSGEISHRPTTARVHWLTESWKRESERWRVCVHMCVCLFERVCVCV